MIFIYFTPQAAKLPDGVSHRKEDLGQNETTAAESMASFSGIASGHPAKKTRHDSTPAPVKSCSAELAAQLSSRLAQLMDAAAASRSNDQIRRCPSDHRDAIPRRCVKDPSGTGRPQSMDASLLSSKNASGKGGDTENQPMSKSAAACSAGGQTATVAAATATMAAAGGTSSRASTQSPVVGFGC